MLTTTELLELYRAEKEALDDIFEPFSSFADWKADYVAEYKKTHRTVDIRVAMREADQAVEEAESELDQSTEGETEMTDTNVDQAKRDAKNARRRELRAAAKTVTATASPKVRAARTGTKTEAAAKIFAGMYPAHPRAEIIAKFQSKAGLSAAGSSTYYQKFLSKAKA